MTKNQIINELKTALDTKRQQAQIEADNFVQSLCEDAEFKSLYTAYNQGKIDMIKAKFSPDKQALDQASKNFTALEKQYKQYISSHNIDVRRMEPNYECSICNDTGVVNGRLCTCLKKELNLRLSEQNKQYKFKTFADCTPNLPANLKKIYEITSAWCEKYPNSHILSVNMLGGTGTGKTFLLECMASRLIERGFNVLFTSAFSLNEECRKYHFSLPSLVNDFMDCDVLIIDDLGTEPVLKNITIEYLFNIINTRQRRYKPTLLSSNFSPEDILNHYGERIYSRLANKLTSLNLEFNGIDMRKDY